MRTRIAAAHEMMLVLTAANTEALRAGHAQIDADHLLLALLVLDGDAAAGLVAAGVSLDAAREALAGVERDDVLALGLGAELADASWLPAVTSPASAPLLPLAPTVNDVGAHYRLRQESDLWLLARLIEDPQGPAARLLRRLGVDGTAVVAARPKAADRPTWSRSTRIELTVPVAATALWRIVDDPTRRPEWDREAGEVEVIDERTFVVTPRLVLESNTTGLGSWLAEKVVTFRVIDQSPGTFVEWELTYPRRPAQRPYLERQSVELTPVEGGTRLTLAESGSQSRFGLVRRWFAATGRRELRQLAQALSQVS